MGDVLAGITTSVDGYIAGPDDGPGRGLGTGGERLHYWVFGGPWSYDEEPSGEMEAEDKAWMDEAMRSMGAVVGGRATYEAAGHWGDENPWDVPFFIVTHRREEQPPGDAFTFVGEVAEAILRAREAAGGKNVHVMGGADVMRQALEQGLVDRLSIIIAPVILGGGKRLFDGFERDIELEHLGVRQSRFATFIDYRVVKS
ncbi:MAG TPA: dihydrofolate reductase family protein [Pedococcus sp.]|nr:dihydrofolate reductase family protein [Pedococcus sp.]